MRISRRRLLQSMVGTGLGLATASAGGISYGHWVETEWLEIVHRELNFERLPSGLDGLRIALLADFHLYPNTRLEYIEQCVAAAQRLRPDLVLLGGDFVQATAEAIFDLAPVLARLSSTLGSFCILGNHDYWKGRDIVEQGLRESGLPLLRNEGRTLEFGHAAFYLAGVDDCWAGQPDLTTAMDGRQAGTFTILLSHEPDPASSYALDERIALQLSGHSHGGQVRFPFMGSPFLPPFGRRYDMGLYRIGNMLLYTNRGIGVTAPIRLNCRPELTLFTLRAGAKPDPSRVGAP
ncbi:MAG: metallophosphoesterase [Acidobacteriota bacterium]